MNVWGRSCVPRLSCSGYSRNPFRTGGERYGGNRFPRMPPGLGGGVGGETDGAGRRRLSGTPLFLLFGTMGPRLRIQRLRNLLPLSLSSIPVVFLQPAERWST